MTAQKRFDDVARGLINSFRKFGGVPKELLFDNMATVSNTNVTPKKPTDSIMQMAKDFGFKVRLCKARSPQTKGTVEARNKIIDWIRAYEGEFETIEELEVLISAVNKDMNISINQETKMSPTALFYKEKEYLKPLPHKSIIDTYLTPNRYRVSSEALIRFNGNRYSVDPKLIDEEVTVDCLDNNLFFNLIAKRYEKLSTVITTNSPFSKWSDIFQEPVLTNALLDRLLHHCSVININGPSYRLKDQMQYMVEEN